MTSKDRDLEIAALRTAIERTHGGKAAFVATYPVHEQFQGRTVWQGLVSLFDLSQHASATGCYAWSVPPTDGKPERFYAVLRTAEVSSPELAVRAAIVADHRKSRG